MITVMLASVIATTFFSARAGSVAQQRSGSTLLSHSQRSLRASPKNLRSKTPRPPRDVGRQTVVQASLHFPPSAVSVPHQRKALRRLSICSMAQVERQHAMLICTGITDNVTLVSNTRPACVSSPDFQSSRRLNPPMLAPLHVSASLATAKCPDTCTGTGRQHMGRPFAHPTSFLQCSESARRHTYQCWLLVQTPPQIAAESAEDR